MFAWRTCAREGIHEAHLVVERKSISDAGFLEMMERPARYKVLGEGTSLLVSVTVKPENLPPEHLRRFLRPYHELRGYIATEFMDTWSPASLSFVEVKIGAPDERQSRLFE
jgi:hypothetical protein